MTEMRIMLNVALVGSALLFLPKAVADTYQDVKSIIDATCVRCHKPAGAARFLPLTTLDEIKPNRELMIELVEAGEMPMGNPDWGTTPDGQRVIAWLTNGADVLPPPPPPTCPPEPPPHLLMRDPRTLRYADVKPIVDRHCTGCHAPGGRMARKPLTSLAEIRRHARDAWEQLDEATMPMGNEAFALTPDGRVLAAWLRFGEDVTWRDPRRPGDDDAFGGGDDDDALRDDIPIDDDR